MSAEHLATALRHLGELGQMSAKTEANEREILRRAEARLTEVERTIGEKRASAVTDQQASADYMAAVKERGQLHQVIAQARSVLGN